MSPDCRLGEQERGERGDSGGVPALDATADAGGGVALRTCDAMMGTVRAEYRRRRAVTLNPLVGYYTMTP